ncbi:M20 family metallopeptidase [Acidaminobacter sp. JC074]|uniref:amidohydrolase n=1 Tax=Acidaminobacter sp. JC074 TaxID=2530199 RepID=UPI001F0D5D03|nr:amidohydrolase [Acidaminobacter sp. JC074]MCH4886341.1 M20 family metallopeptidase [Acidaminobacter sp. JC074]
MTKYIDNHAEELIDLSLRLHDHPETAFKEHKACKWLCDYLSEKNFNVVTPVADLETAFVAKYDTGKVGPHIAYIAEYDALPEIGHGCGHNLIATMSVGAAVGLSNHPQVSGVIYVIGTPAEEGGGGKVMMLEKGVFDPIDYAMMIHPATENLIMRGGLATRGIKIMYHGKAAHSSAPEDGVNALSAVIETFNAIDRHRALMPIGHNINGIITEGGIASNIIPNSAACKFSVRAKTSKELEVIMKDVHHIIDSTNHLIGTKSTVKEGLTYTERFPNKPMAETLKGHMEKYGIMMKYPRPDMKIGSSDIGNVSLKLPTIHSYLNIWDELGEKPKAHSQGFTRASRSEFAHERMLIGAKVLSETGLSILEDQKLREDIDDYFKSK